VAGLRGGLLTDEVDDGLDGEDRPVGSPGAKAGAEEPAHRGAIALASSRRGTNNPLKVVVIVGKPRIVAAVIGLVHDLLPLGRNGQRRKPDRIMPSGRDQNTSAAMAGVSWLDVIPNSG
jgi:hypothetical protein